MSQIVPSGSIKRSSQPRQRRVVLSEEEYTSTLEEIVQREYFPDLPALQRQAAVLEKRAVGDIAGAVAVRRAARQLQNHEEGLAEKEAEDEHDLVDAPDGKGSLGIRRSARPLHRETVTGFHARVTSEDNREFDKTQQEEIEAQRQRRQEAFQQSNPVLRITDSSPRIEPETPLLASDKFNAPLNRIEASQWKDTSKQRDSFFFTPQRGEASSIEGNPSGSLMRITSGEKDNKSSKSVAALMPPPAPVRQGVPSASSSSLSIIAHSPDQQKALSSDAPKEFLVEYTPKHTLEKRIEPSQTRFPSNPSKFSLSIRTHRLEGDESSAAGYSTDGTSASTDLDETSSLSLSQERRAHARRQRRDQETLVAMTPLVVPGRGDEAGDSSPIITWGSVASTPLVLSGVDSASKVVEPTPFTLPEEDHRQEAARKAEAKLEHAKQQRTAARPKKRQRTNSRTPLDRTTESLTPAARSLLEKTAGSKSIFASSVRSRGAFGSALRSSYTPRTKSRSMQSIHASTATPRPYHSTQTKTNKTPLPKSGHITDGLLQIAKK